MSKKIESQKFSLEAGKAELKANFNAYTPQPKDGKPSKMRGFIFLSIYRDGEFSHSWSDVKVFEGDGELLYITEPSRKVEKNGETKWVPNFLLPKKIKEDVGKKLTELYK